MTTSKSNEFSLSDIFLRYQRDFITSPKKRKLWISARQIGKSFTIAAILCYKALQKKNNLSLCISTGARASAEIIRKCSQFAEAIRLLSKGAINYTSSFDQIKFSNGCRIVSLPSSTDGSNLRGYTAACVCVDEAAYIWHLDTILQAINPTLSRDPEAELVLTTTPAGMNGPFYELYQHALHDDDWHVQTTSIHEAIADGLKVSLESLKSLCPDPEVFAVEYECKFASEFGSFLNETCIDFCSSPPMNGSQYYLGMDIGRKADKTGIVILKSNGSEHFLEDVIMLTKCEYSKQIDIIKQLHAKYHFKAGFIDEGGIGSAVAEQITKEVCSQLKGMSFTAANKTPLYESVRAAVFDHKLKFNEEFKKTILDDFRNVTRQVSETGVVRYSASRNEHGHSDFTSALVLAVEAAKQHPVCFDMPLPNTFNSKFGSFVRI